MTKASHRDNDTEVILGAINDLATLMDKRFEQVNARFEQVDARFEQVDRNHNTQRKNQHIENE